MESLYTVFCFRVSRVTLKVSSGLESHLNLSYLPSSYGCGCWQNSVIWAKDLKALAPSGGPQPLAMWSSPSEVHSIAGCFLKASRRGDGVESYCRGLESYCTQIMCYNHWSTVLTFTVKWNIITKVTVHPSFYIWLVQNKSHVHAHPRGMDYTHTKKKKMLINSLGPFWMFPWSLLYLWHAGATF